MSKNLTRKGLAFGALVALGASVIAGTPANAAVSALSIGSTYGTSTNTILGQGFNVAVSGTGISGTTGEFKVFVEGAVASDLATIGGVKGVTNLADATGATAFGSAPSVTTVSATDKTAVITGIENVAATYTELVVGLDTTAVTATRTIKLTPFVDNIIADGKPTPGEVVAGTPISITYNKGSEVTATTTIKAPLIGDTTGALSALVTLDKGINLEQFKNVATSSVNLDFKANGTGTVTVSNITYSSTDAALKGSITGIGTIAANTVYSAQAKIGTTASGALSTTTVAAGATTVANDTNAADFVTATKGANVRKASTNSYGVRTGTTTVSFSTGTIKKATSSTDATQISVGAGLPAKVTVVANALASGSKFTAGGKTVDTAGNSVTFDTVTNADGKVVFDLTATGAKGDDAKVIVNVLSASAWTANTVYTYASWADATQTSDPVLLDAVGTTSSASGTISSVAVKAGGSYTLNFALYDNFGALYSGTSRWLQVTGGSVTQFVGGKASITRNDSNVAAATNALYYSATTTDTVATPTSGELVNVYAQTNTTAGFVTATKSGSPTISTATFAAGDARNGSSTYAFSTTDLGTAVAISGTVLNTTGVALKGVPVTITGAGILFSDGYQNTASDQVWGVGSLTVLTDETGAYNVNAYSNKAGVQAITVTSGTATATTSPEWAAAAATAGYAITITAPAATAPGTTAAVVVKLTDKQGNAVKTDGATGLTFTVRVTGAGTPGTINEYTNASGETRFNVVVGSGETGSFTVTVTYDADAALTVSAPIVKAATTTISSGPVAADPSAKIGSASHRVFVKIFDAKGARVTVKIDGKWFTFYNSNFSSPTVWSKYFALVKTAVKVYVDGDLVAAKTLKVVK